LRREIEEAEKKSKENINDGALGVAAINDCWHINK